MIHLRGPTPAAAKCILWRPTRIERILWRLGRWFIPVRWRYNRRIGMITIPCFSKDIAVLQDIDIRKILTSNSLKTPLHKEWPAPFSKDYTIPDGPWLED